MANNRTNKHILNKVYALHYSGFLFLKYILTFSILEISNDRLDSFILNGSICVIIIQLGWLDLCRYRLGHAIYINICQNIMDSKNLLQNNFDGYLRLENSMAW